jgi:hypothetical protein
LRTSALQIYGNLSRIQKWPGNKGIEISDLTKYQQTGKIKLQRKKWTPPKKRGNTAQFEQQQQFHACSLTFNSKMYSTTNYYIPMTWLFKSMVTKKLPASLDRACSKTKQRQDLLKVGVVKLERICSPCTLKARSILMCPSLRATVPNLTSDTLNSDPATGA